MSKRVVLVGHCGPDSSYLRMAIKAADPAGQIISADSEAELTAELSSGADLVLVNRIVDYGFDTAEGVEIVRMYRKAFPKSTLMLISNYPEAQTDAIAAGALPGFGKREIGTPKVKQMLRSALGLDDPAIDQRATG